MSYQDIVQKYDLDVSVITLDDVLKAWRIDSEYYKPIFIQGENLIEKNSFFVLNSNADVRGGKRLPLNENFAEEGVPYIRAEDVKNAFVDYISSPKIPFELHERLKSYQTKYNDVLITIVGNSIGDIGLVRFNLDKCNLTENCAKIVNLRDITPEFLFAFLLSNYGQNQIVREKVGTSQPKLALVRIRKFKVPRASSNFQMKIKSCIDNAHSLFEHSKQTYTTAQTLLLHELGLEIWKPTENTITERELVECLRADRFDAEYWQPAYDVILDTLSKYKKGVSTIGDEFKQLKNNFKAEKNKEYHYIEISDVNVSTGEVEHNAISGAELPANAKIKFGKRQLIISKVRPNRGATTILDNHEGYIGSGAFTVLIEKEGINLETLMVYLKTQPIRELLLRYNTGTSYPVITNSDVLKLPMPLVDAKIQKRISELVSLSATERQETKDFFEKAKRAVEIFIEQDEKTAMEYLKNIDTV